MPHIEYYAAGGRDPQEYEQLRLQHNGTTTTTNPEIELIEYYKSQGYDPDTAAYLATGRRPGQAAVPEPKSGGGGGGPVLTPLDYAAARLEVWAARVKAGDMEYKYSRNAFLDEIDYYNTVTWPRYQAEEQNRQNVYEAEWKRFNAQEASERARVDLEMAKQGERTTRSGLVAREILPRAIPAGSMVNLGGAGGGSFEVPSVNLNTFMDQGMTGITYTPPPLPGVYEPGAAPGAPVFTATPPPGVSPVPEEGF